MGFPLFILKLKLVSRYFIAVYLSRYDAALLWVGDAIAKAQDSNPTALPVIMCNKASIMMYSGKIQEKFPFLQVINGYFLWATL